MKTKFEKLWKSLGNMWKSVNIFTNVWKSLGNCEIVWKNKMCENLWKMGKCVEKCEKVLKYVKCFLKMWGNCLKICENVWKLWKMGKCYFKCKKMCEKEWKSLEKYETFWISRPCYDIMLPIMQIQQ